MKKFIAMLLIMVTVIGVIPTTTVEASTNAFGVTTKLNWKESKIIKSYVKAYEAGNINKIASYVYPGQKIELPRPVNVEYLKVYPYSYSKKYDGETKMNYLTASCIIVTHDGADITIFKGTIGVDI